MEDQPLLPNHLPPQLMEVTLPTHTSQPLTVDTRQLPMKLKPHPMEVRLSALMYQQPVESPHTTNNHHQFQAHHSHHHTHMKLPTVEMLPTHINQHIQDMKPLPM